MAMMELTQSLRKTITIDWQSALLGFVPVQLMNLARRVGPFVQGVCLDRDTSNSAYLPTLYVHCLCRPFPVLSLSLGQPLMSQRSGVVDRLMVQSHENIYQDACRRLLGSSLLPVQGDWRISDVLAAHEAYQRLSRPDSRFPVYLWEDAVSAYVWMGDQAEAVALADRYVEVAKRWPETVLAREGGVARWQEKLGALARAGDSLGDVVVDQIRLLKLDGLPVSKLLK